MPEETRDVFDKAKRSFAELLLVDIATAMISLDVSEATHNPETREKERSGALQSHETVSRFLDRNKLKSEDTARIAAALEPLKSRLDAIGQVPSQT